MADSQLTLEERTWMLLKRYGVDASQRAGWPWQRAVLRQVKAILRQAIKRALRGALAVRGQQQILSEYGGQWRKKGFEKYRPRDLKGEGGPWVWRGFRFALSNEAGAAVRLIFLEEAMARLQPHNVLEVGCGNGINLHLLSARFPQTRFTGLEATMEGCAAAQRVVDEGRLPAELQEFAPFELRDLSAVARVKIVKGSGGELPFGDRSFDLVLTSLALEQMEEIRERALAEVVRVAARDVVMLEPFHEVNRSGLRRRYVRTYDYFQGSVADLERYGLKVTSVTSDMPHKAWLGTAVVVARRAG
jgi:ubiquinone/menaquinone biosynthesis C-methylase UbiE